MTRRRKSPPDYDGLARRIRDDTNAHIVLLLTIGGSLGNGLTVQAAGAPIDGDLPATLRRLADVIEARTATKQ